MATYEGKSGQSYTTIEPFLGKGGEGAVYALSGQPNYVMKIYLPGQATETRHRKLLTMLSTKLSLSAMQQITWPTDVVYQNGKFAGYVMPKLSGAKELNVMYSDKYQYTLSEKITIAKNLCAALNSVHEAGQVCGDLNPKNIGVDPNEAKVTLLDTDSYHITDGNAKVYRCEVGMPEYLACEVQGKIKNGNTLANAQLPTFSKETDLFALAVHIFALLMNGCHPFACAVNNGSYNIGQLTASQPSVTAPQPIDNICDGFFPFYEKRTGITTPKYAPDFNVLPKEIQDLFIKAFVDGHKNPAARPDAATWYYALEKMQQNLLKCSKDRFHMYPSHLKKCPWCELEQKMKTTIPKVAAIQQTALTSPPVVNTYNKQANGTTPRPTNATQPTTPMEKTLASPTIFWIGTIALALVVQSVAMGIFGNTIIGETFGYGYGDGWESWGTNLAVWFGPWGFVICAIIGTVIYNTYWCKSGKQNGYKWYHYVLSLISSIAFSIGWILVIFIITLAIYLLIGAIIVAVVCAFLSGS